ncbi:MAG: hypothetical protein D6720_07755 [Gammaproteobacteria bacterium]|nr:MAG: hypothetical protein D6720_07755 [Gammaproteobacteria bacterium]
MPRKQFKTPKIVTPGRRPVWPWLAILVVVGGAWLAYDYGRRSAGYYAAASTQRIQALEARISTLEGECQEQRELAARYQRASQIDRAAAQAVQESLKSLEAERAELQQKVVMLNSLLSGKVSGLEVTEIKVGRQGEPATYALEFSISKRGKGEERVTGRLELQVIGRRDGKKTVLKEKQLGLKQPFKMGFKHFQRFQGVVRFPKDFTPEQILIKGLPAGKKFKKFEKRVAWSAALG